MNRLGPLSHECCLREVSALALLRRYSDLRHTAINE
jgi:hypothetical protein